MKIIFSTLLILLSIACKTASEETGSSDSVVLASENIPATRAHVNDQAVKTYTETIKSFETTDEFKVSIYETQLTFKYLLKISYKQLEVNDTLRVPNFGIQPAVELKKGDSVHPSCIIGFLDKEQKFRESKLVYFKDEK